ncbi:hypothetical protein [Pandoraea apista]|uniref:hypothetical protein n=1 Tax=Pandoraea apista TaxID=93218 RepID=UPI00058A7D67|nr:hypothetical protein [Pandoraea apista]AJE98934.1 hypothetical protein SG18_13290 [Pandoraea apista]AKH73017.1 hypothetical protein XM39_13485 [Pandoraea apista]AKI61402.1 hypothetical protein AA956_05745 [Pandoraea apista]
MDDLLTGEGSLNFVEGDTQVRVGWLRAGGDGLIVTARVDEGVIGQTRFWCDAQQWCDWLAADLPVPSWDDLPPAWHANAASLTLATQGAGEEADGEMPRDGASEHAFREAWPGTGDVTSWPSATVLLRARVETAWRVGMVLQRAGRQLALMYLDGASAWLRERCRRATPGDTPLDPAGWPERRCALVAGWVTLPATQGHDLHAGDAVLLDVAADIERGEYWLVDGEFAVAMCDGRPSDRHVVQFGDADRQGGGDGRCPLVCRRGRKAISHSVTDGVARRGARNLPSIGGARIACRTNHAAMRPLSVGRRAFAAFRGRAACGANRRRKRCAAPLQRNGWRRAAQRYFGS